MKCPFCNTLLINSTTHCPNNLKLPCLECIKCHSYFYSRSNYFRLRDLAKENNKKLSSKVYYFSESIFKESYDVKKEKPLKNKIKKSKIKNSSKTPKNNKITATINIPIEDFKITRHIASRKECTNYRNGFCIYIDDKCNPQSLKCHYIRITNYKDKNNTDSIQIKNKSTLSNNKRKQETHNNITAIVLSNNKLCFCGNHKIIDVCVIIKVATKFGKVTNVEIPGAFCPACNQYIILKKDYILAKNKGVLLCQIEDKTPQYKLKHKNNFCHENESRIHMLGYNVIKKYNYTQFQRQMILANIIENTDITVHEILSIIDMNIARHQSQFNYSDAVKKWEQDRNFVVNYQLGDCHEVILDKIKVGKR